MDKSTDKWLAVINSGRAYSNHQQFDRLNLEKVAEHHFCNIIQKHVSQGETILEAGCGSAYDSFYLSSLNIKVTALDISEKLIQELQQVRKVIKASTKSNLELVVGSIFELKKLNKKFNLIFNHGVYEHWPKEERYQILQNASSALVDKGRYIVATPNLESPLFHAALSNNEVPEMWEFNLSELEDELRQNGFKIIETGYLFVSPGFEQWLGNRWMAYPINFINKIYYRFPRIIRKLLAAHIYCVAEKL